MTDREKAIVMAYTGITMLKGEKFEIFHRYAEELMGKPLLTHEIADNAVMIKEKSTQDFMNICANEPAGYWVTSPTGSFACPFCGYRVHSSQGMYMRHCPECGERLEVLQSDMEDENDED